MEKVLYTVYRIRNKINDKIYVGVHKTTDINDGYMGSGTIIRKAIERYGIENFDKEILHVFDNPEDMYRKEAIIVNSSFVKTDNTYNINIGGFGGFEYINLNGYRYVVSDHMDTDFFIECGRKGAFALHEKCKNDPIFAKEVQTKRSNSRKGIQTFLGKSHTHEAKEKISIANSNNQRGKKNSQYGSMWIMNSESGEFKKIKKTDNIPSGWVKGRKKPYTKKCPICKDPMESKKETCSRKCSGIYKSPYYKYREEILQDYNDGKSLDYMKNQYGFPSEQSLTGFLNRHFPNRKRFTPKGRC